MPEYLQASDIFVFPTENDAFPSSLIEAMSAKCAIVASDTAPVREAIIGGQTGVLVDFFDQDKLIEETCALLDAPERRDFLGANARRFARERYDLRRICLPRQLKWVDDLAAVYPVRQPMD